MVPKKSRLPGGEFHSRTYKTIKTPYFLLKAKRSASGRPKIGVVVGKAVHKSAVRRNFWKRQAKAVLSEATSPMDFLIIISSKANEATRKQFRDTLTKSIKQC